MKKAVLGAVGVVVVIAGIVYVLDEFKILSDEPPIRVRNGSIDVIAGMKNGEQWKWVAEGDGYSHEHSGDFDITRNLWVKVETNGVSGSDYTCNTKTGDGREVELYFLSDAATVTARLKRVGPFWNQRTKVQPKDAFGLYDGDTILRSTGAGYVTRVHVGQLDCTFNTKEALNTIYICMSSSDTACQ